MGDRLIKGDYNRFLYVDPDTGEEFWNDVGPGPKPTGSSRHADNDPGWRQSHYYAYAGIDYRIATSNKRVTAAQVMAEAAHTGRSVFLCASCDTKFLLMMDRDMILSCLMCGSPHIVDVQVPRYVKPAKAPRMWAGQGSGQVSGTEYGSSGYTTPQTTINPDNETEWKSLGGSRMIGSLDLSHLPPMVDGDTYELHYSSDGVIILT